MKILQIIQQNQLRGAEIFACQLSVELIKMGNEVDVLILSENENNLQYDINFLYANANLKNRFFDIKTYKRIAKIIKEGEYDIVQSNGSDTLKYAVFSKYLYKWNAKLILRNIGTLSNYIRDKYTYQFNKILLRKIDSIISVSTNSHKDFIQLYPSLKHISTAIPIATYNFDHVSPYKKKDLNEVWIHIGSFVWEKNHSFLIDIFYNYLKQFPDTVLWLFGEGSLMKEIKLKVKKLNIQDKVIFFGYRKDIIPFLKASDVMIMPSVNEGLPGVILESLSCGIPVVSSKVGGIPEVIIDNKTGYSIKDFKTLNYINKTKLLLKNPKKYKQISNNCRYLIKEKYSINIISKRFYNHYISLLD